MRRLRLERGLLPLLLAAAGGPLLLPAEAGKGGSPVRLPGARPEVVRVEGRPPERVSLTVSVLDARGEPVGGLEGTDFLVKEDGVLQALVEFGRQADRQDQPLSAVFLVDRSGSVARQMGKWKEAVAALASSLRPIDEVRLAAFTTDVTVLQEFTSDPAALLAAASRGLQDAGGGTRVFAALEETLRDLRHRPGRKAVFLLTDGLDNDLAGEWSVTGQPYLEALLRKAVAGEVLVITILPGPTGRPFLAVQDLAVQTGGWWLYPSDDLPGLVARLGRRLLESYHLAYDSTRPPDERRRRTVEVALTGTRPQGIEVRTVAGVFGQMPLVDLLAEDLARGDEDQRARAAAGLASMPHQEAAEALRRALRDQSARVRAAAVRALGERRDPRAARWLAKRLEDPDPAVRQAAAQALRRLLASAPERDQARILDALEEAEEEDGGEAPPD
ncbi:MAG TPA: VWA domain-containing protein [Candidatus Polarisedimenticolia bacterium]|nr:VWA domain-containing protein [Candidatus Polarisedimenticolia bacterium]